MPEVATAQSAGLPEGLEGVVQAGLDGAFGDVQCEGDFLDGEFFDDAEEDDLALVVR